jgi:hypothetical protein
MTAIRCPVCNLPWLTQPAPWNNTGILRNADENHLGSDIHWVFCFIDTQGSKQTIAIRKDDVVGSANHLQSLEALRTGGDPDEEIPKDRKRIPSNRGHSVLLRRPEGGGKIQVHNVPMN